MIFGLISTLFLLCVFLLSGSLAECEDVDIRGVDKAYLFGLYWYFVAAGIDAEYVPFTKKEAETAVAGGHIGYFKNALIDIDFSGDYACIGDDERNRSVYFFNSLVNYTKENSTINPIFRWGRESDIVDISGLDKADLLISLWLGGLKNDTFYFESEGVFHRQTALDAVKSEIFEFEDVFIGADLSRDLVDCTHYDLVHKHGLFEEIVKDQPRKISENYTHYFRYKKPETVENKPQSSMVIILLVSLFIFLMPQLLLLLRAIW